ncbi:hypothetical protein RchiOBHm_Chr3g0481511 [Rosa chinensis]|uniref:Uncharacterized protein n=1 Tax=Rosa chinensis TaxID=74649 RepID=A0A2P6RE00_ROSCH|nr:hypothetical protein RchiOBHm_Chr3g0481511 [Rosa chinensis]
MPKFKFPHNMQTLTKVLQSIGESGNGLVLMKSMASENFPARPKRSTMQPKCSITDLVPYFGSISLNKHNPVSHIPE